MNRRSVLVVIFLTFLLMISLACSSDQVLSQVGINKVREYNMARKVDKAIMAAKDYLRTNPGDPEALTILGENYGRKKDFLSAEKSLKQALRVQPKNAWAIRALAAVYLMQAQETDSPNSKANYLALALKKIEEGLIIFPNDPLVNLQAAEIYFEKKDKSKAEEYIGKTLMIAPGNTYAGSLKKRILDMP